MSPGHPALISEDAAPTHNCIPGSRCQAGDLPSLLSAVYLPLLGAGDSRREGQAAAWLLAKSSQSSPGFLLISPFVVLVTFV